ncbi:MAG: hypothetical protein F6K62_26735, partial [Sphaerospermopsis sp. SIO1G2]|nr:hypothetical protein [Sphaerospermopsis sp. SIO1G2]
YPQIQAILRTSCKTGAGLDTLHHALRQAISTLPHVDDLIPEKWAAVKRGLEEIAQQKDIIPYGAFNQLCLENEIVSKQTLLKLMHDLGVVLNFYRGDEKHYKLEETNILNPEWVTQGVYALLNSEPLKQANGVLHKPDLRHLLPRDRYPSSQEHDFILEMMRQFELCYPFAGGDRYLIPALLPESEPEAAQWDEQNTLQFRYEYPEFFPSSILSRFMVRQYTRIVQGAPQWRRGLVITFDGQEALIRADVEAQLIHIFVRGHQDEARRRRELLAIIRHEFEHIHASFANLEAVPMVRVPGYDHIFIEYDEVTDHEAMGLEVYKVPGKREKASVRETLEGVDGGTRYDPKTLREKIANYFHREGDMKSLCADFGIPFGHLDGGNIRDKARELVDHAMKHGRLGDLWELCRKEFPNGFR